jgi:hypothetical protein
LIRQNQTTGCKNTDKSAKVVVFGSIELHSRAKGPTSTLNRR